MSKSTVLYAAMCALLALGLWGVMAAGSHLRAPYALAGTWVPVEPAEAQAVPFTISQSGLFLSLQPEGREPFDLRWKEETVDGSGMRTIQLSGTRESVRVRIIPTTQPNQEPEHRFEFSGTIHGIWSAVREMNPDDLNAKAAHHPH